MSIDKYLEENRSTVRTATSRRCYRDKLGRAEREIGPLLEATGPDLARFLTSKDWAPQTVRSYKVVLVSYYRWALRSGQLHRDPTVSLDDIRPPARGVRKQHWLSAAQARHLIETCPDTLVGQRDRAAVATLVLTGLRARELTRVRWGHLETSKAVLHVLGKGDKHAEVGITDQLARELEMWRDLFRRNGASLEGEAPVIPALQNQFQTSPEGRTCVLGVTQRAISVEQLRALVGRAGHRIGIEKLAPHDLRRTLAGLLENEGIRLEDIQKVLRHSSVATTQRYLSTNPSKGAEVLRAFRL